MWVISLQAANQCPESMSMKSSKLDMDHIYWQVGVSEFQKI